MTRGGRTWSFHGSPRLKAWRDAVAEAAQAAFQGPPRLGPVAVGITFLMPRPKADVDRHGQPKPTAPTYPAVRPDIDRLVRSVLDAITGVVIADDAQVVHLEAGKVYAPPGMDPGAAVLAWTWERTLDGRPGWGGGGLVAPHG